MHFRKNKYSSVALAVSVVLGSAASAENTDGSSEKSELRLAKATILHEVVVSGSRIETALTETPMAIGRVDGDDMRRDKPKTMGDLINRIAGVSWNDLGNEQHSMGIRQPNSTNAVYQYLEDGIPIRPLGVFNHNSLNELNMAGSESVEVVKGPASSLYGSNAVGGAVNFLSAKPSLTPFASVAVRNEDIAGFNRYDAVVSDTFGDVGIRLGAYSSRRNENNWQEYSYGDKDSVTVRTDYRLTDSVALRATYTYSDLDSAMTGGVFETDFLTNPGHSINTFTYRRDKTQRATIAAEFNFFDSGKTTLTGFWRKNDHGQLPSYTITGCGATPATANTCRGTINNNHVDSLGLDAKHVQEFDWARSRLIGGVYLDVSDNPYVSDNLTIQRTTVVTPSGGLATVQYVSYALNNVANPVGVRDYQTDILNYAPFFQFETSPIDSVRIVAGGRYDAVKYDFTNNLAPGPQFGARNETRTFAHFSPKLGATYSITDGISVYVNASEGFTAPDVSQLYGKSEIPDLKPATYRNYEAGARLAFFEGALKFDTAVYQLEGKDTIVSFTDATGNSVNRNAGKTRSRGFEFAATFDSKVVDARLGAAFASHQFLVYRASGAADRNYDGKEMPQSPSLISAEVGVTPIRDLRFAVEGIRQGEYWMNNQNTVRYDGHTLLNVRGSYSIKLWGNDWNLWLSGRNLTNERYSDSASSTYNGLVEQLPNLKDTQNSYTPGAPRTVMLGFTYTFGAK